MEKPSDYSTYFNEDGTKKENPYKFGDIRVYQWRERYKEIRYMLMNKKEKDIYSEFQRYQKSKYDLRHIQGSLIEIS